MTQRSTVRFAVHADQCKAFDTSQLRQHFLVEELFKADAVHLVYTHYDRFIVGGVMPVTKEVRLETIVELKSEYFLERREIGIINVGEAGTVKVDGEEFNLDKREAIYIGKGKKDLRFGGKNALFYFNSAPAHAAYPTRKISLADAETVALGSLENANQRTVRKLIVQSKVQSCQLQMGITELKSGSVWNSMPPHTHDRRMEVYFYLNVPDGNAISHFMGEPTETRHLWVHNHQAVISPPWSIHCGAGTSSYAFIWGMAGENLDYGDMDSVKPQDLV